MRLAILFALLTACSTAVVDDVCVPACRSGFVCDLGVCTSACNPECGDGFTCNEGECIANACAAGHLTCDSTCIDPATDALHCGATNLCTGDDAGTACTDRCVAGHCVLTDITIRTSVANYDLFIDAGAPTTPLDLHVSVPGGVTISSLDPSLAAFTTGALPPGSTVTLIVDGQIIGAGGAGGSGGNGGSGGTPRGCGRPGTDGGTAITITVPTTIANHGLIGGGGGGGGGVSGCNTAAGGGGGAGTGAAGRGATTLTQTQELAFCGQDNTLRTGSVGTAGTDTAGGTGGTVSSGAGGRGGALGLPGAGGLSCVGSSGNGEGGAAGHAIRRGSQPLRGIADGIFATGTGSVRGPVGP